MKIEVLGTGCAKCEKLKKNVEKAIEKLSLNATVEKVSELSEIMKYGVMSTPALVVDGQVKASGKSLSVEEITEMLH